MKKLKNLRALNDLELKNKLQELKAELSREKGAVAAGTKPENPGGIREIKKNIARILTIVTERQRGGKPVGRNV